MSSQPSTFRLEDSTPMAEDAQQQLVTIAPTSRGRWWLMVSGVACFVFTFAVHQSLYLTSAADDTPLATAAPVSLPLAAPQSAPSPTIDVAIQPKESAAIAVASVPDDPDQQALEAALLAPAPAAGAEQSASHSANVQQPSVLDAQAQEVKRLQLALLHQKAEAALSRDRLTTPANDNAVHYFRSMLALDGNHPTAKAGLMRVADRYYEFYQRLMARGETRAAQKMLSQAQSIAPDRLHWAELPNKTLPSQPDAPVANAPAVDAQDATSRTTAVAQVSQSTQARRAQLIQQARSAIAGGEPSEAIGLLAAELPNAPTNGDLTEVLHQAYIGAGRTSEAVSLRVTLQGVAPNYRLARMQSAELLQAGQLEQAVEVLERNLPSYNQDSNYYGFLAGLYYKARRYKDAEQAYEKLLAINPTLGSYWLGYAVALDAQGDVRARRAFERATQTLSDKDAAREYAVQRMRALGQS
ncbi:hypothetical protein [Simiduia aestuariiviva]|uniref:Tetratricopeptide (TPR) repeat protein n=1 Tax=Simiduia aestuariiviva TaxID=1510459 RepID=A0A839ULN6_9GAMM|nr:hypothetical protein [Simiduia aestuariiviva]MBB3168762.1 tetratricopeptide (TPR) repeat protein [Simiduia aestuariiviva]